MKKFIIPALLFAAVLTSCGSDAVTASDAKEVEVVTITGTYANLGDHNHVDWKAWHLGKTGERFGTVTLSSAEASVNESALVGGKFVMDLTALTVENFGEDTAQNEKLRGHLTSGDFFLTDSFPTATFEITSVDTTSGDLIEVKTSIECEGVFSKSIELLDKIIVYPNPTNGIVTISNIQEKNIDVTVYDLNGRALLNTTNSQVDISNLTSGVYLFKVKAEKSEVLKRIVKQ